VARDDRNRPSRCSNLEFIPLLLPQWKAQKAEIINQRALIEQHQDWFERQEKDLAK